MKVKYSYLFLLKIFIPLVLASFAHAQPSYTIKDLGTLGGDTSYGLDVNNLGQVTGHSEDASGKKEIFIWENDLMTEIPGFNLNTGSGLAISNQGDIVGRSLATTGHPESWLAFFWDSTTGIESLGTLPGFFNSDARDVNDSGMVVGHARTQNVGGSFTNRAYLWTSEQGMVQLDNAGAPFVGANAINNHGVIVGSLAFNDRVNHAFVGDVNQITQLSPPIDHVSSTAFDINDNGIIVGHATHQDIVQGASSVSAFVGDVNGLNSIGAIGNGANGTYSARAQSINNHGYVVGRSTVSGASGLHAFIYHDSFGMLDLNDLVDDLSGWSYLEEGMAISDTGYITGVGVLPSGEKRAFLLTEIQPVDIIVDNNGECTGPVAEWIPINYDILFFIPGPGQNWQLETASNGQYGQDYYYLDGLLNDGKPEFQWTFSVPETGVYELEAWWPNLSSSTATAEYHIQSDAGNTLVVVPQNVDGGQWNSLGSFQFTADQHYRVKLSAPSGEPVVADAIRISR